MIKCQKSIEVKCFCKNFTPTIDKEPKKIAPLWYYLFLVASSGMRQAASEKQSTGLFLPQFRSNPVSPKLGNLLFDSTHFYINKKDSTLMILSLFGGFNHNQISVFPYFLLIS